MGVERSTFPSRRHGALHYRVWQVAQPRAHIVFLHGWGDHGGHYAALGERCADHRISAWAPDFFGHGSSPGPRARVHQFSHLVEDLHDFMSALSAPAPVYLCGHSMGGCLAGHYAVHHPERIAGVIFNSAALAVNRRVPWWKRALCLGLGGVWSALSLGQLKEARHMTRSRTMQEHYRADTAIHHGPIDAGTGRSLLLATRWLEGHAHAFSVPFLALQGLDDELVAVTGPRRLAERSPASGTLVEYAGARHDLLLDLGVDELFRAINAWMDQQLGPTGFSESRSSESGTSDRPT